LGIPEESSEVTVSLGSRVGLLPVVVVMKKHVYVNKKTIQHVWGNSGASSAFGASKRVQQRADYNC
jgi:hypothetical protein